MNRSKTTIRFPRTFKSILLASVLTMGLPALGQTSRTYEADLGTVNEQDGAVYDDQNMQGKTYQQYLDEQRQFEDQIDWDNVGPLYEYEGDGLKMIVTDERETEREYRVSGDMEFDGNRFPFTASTTGDDDKVAGHFTANGQQFRFTAEVDRNDGNKLIVKTGQSTFVLSYVEPPLPVIEELDPEAPGGNPLSNPNQPEANNPLSGGQSPHPKANNPLAEPGYEAGGRPAYNAPELVKDEPAFDMVDDSAESDTGPGMNITMTMGARGDADYQQLEKAGQAFDNGDYQAAYRIFKPLAEKGHMGAAYMMGLNYKFGNVDPVDSAKAVEWFEKGLRVSHPGSMYHLSWNMRNGSGTQKDFQGGVELLKQAAHRGHLTAINDFGGDILNGNYKASTAEGIAYIMIAADHGERTAVDNLEKLKRNNDQQTISQARKIADEQLLPEIQNSAGSGDFILGYHSYVVVTPK